MPSRLHHQQRAVTNAAAKLPTASSRLVARGPPSPSMEARPMFEHRPRPTPGLTRDEQDY
jgi:hypothetical protein